MATAKLQKASNETTRLAASLSGDEFSEATRMLQFMRIGYWNPTKNKAELIVARGLAAMGYLRECTDTPRLFAFTPEGEKVKGDLRKWKAATKVKDSGSKTKESEVGKKLSAKDVTPKWEKGTLRYAFCIRFRELAGNRSPEELGQIIGCSHDLVRKWLRGIRTPEIDTLPRVAKAFGLKHWIELFEPTKKK